MARRAAIVGVGLMGGSLGMALRALARRRPSKAWRVVGIGRDAARLGRAKRLGAADEVTTDLAAGVRSADVVVLAVPVGDIVRTGRKVLPHLKHGALLMDVGSVKGPIVRALGGRKPSGADFIGAHPMCGSEKAGVENARADLYRGAPCVLTPAAGAGAGAVAAAEKFWRGVGAKVVRLSPEEHDRRVAVVSHLPHLLAEALVLAAARGKNWVPQIAAGSFRDATRVASADPALWASIFAMNRAAVRAAATGFQAVLARLLRAGPSQALLARARKDHLILSRGKS